MKKCGRKCWLTRRFDLSRRTNEIREALPVGRAFRIGKSPGAVSTLNRSHIEPFTEDFQRRPNPINPRGMADICEPIDLLRSSFQSPRRFRRPNILLDHLIQ